jgi:hypothetical protein
MDYSARISTANALIANVSEQLKHGKSGDITVRVETPRGVRTLRFHIPAAIRKNEKAVKDSLKCLIASSKVFQEGSSFGEKYTRVEVSRGKDQVHTVKKQYSKAYAKASRATLTKESAHVKSGKEKIIKKGRDFFKVKTLPKGEFDKYMRKLAHPHKAEGTHAHKSGRPSSSQKPHHQGGRIRHAVTTATRAVSNVLRGRGDPLLNEAKKRLLELEGEKALAKKFLECLKGLNDAEIDVNAADQIYNAVHHYSNLLGGRSIEIEELSKRPNKSKEDEDKLASLRDELAVAVKERNPSLGDEISKVESQLKGKISELRRKIKSFNKKISANANEDNYASEKLQSDLKAAKASLMKYEQAMQEINHMSKLIKLDKDIVEIDSIAKEFERMMPAYVHLRSELRDLGPRKRDVKEALTLFDSISKDKSKELLLLGVRTKEYKKLVDSFKKCQDEGELNRLSEKMKDKFEQIGFLIGKIQNHKKLDVIKGFIGENKENLEFAIEIEMEDIAQLKYSLFEAPQNKITFEQGKKMLAMKEKSLAEHKAKLAKYEKVLSLIDF